MTRREFIALCGCTTAASLVVDRLGPNAQAQTSARPAPQPLLPSYSEAKQAFESQSVENRLRLQVLLTAAGYLSAAANEQFNGRIFRAIQNFKRANALIPDGILNEAALAQLVAEATPFLKNWDMQQRFHLFTMRKLWVPVGLLQIAEPISTGMVYKDPFGRVRMEHSLIEDADLAYSYQQSLEKARIETGTVRFKIIRPNFYTTAWTSAGGSGAYVRYHRLGTGLYGFSLFWDKTAGDIKTNRIATLVSVSLTCDLRGRALIDPLKVLSPSRAAIVVTAPASGVSP
jgi:serine protease Do